MMILNAGIEFRVAAFLIEGGNINGDIFALSGVEDDVGIPGIASHDRRGKTLGSSLFDDKSGSFGRGRSEEDIAAFVLSLGDVRGEVAVAILEFFGDHFAAESLEGFGEVMNKTAGIVVAELGEAVCLSGVKVFLRVVRKNCALERIEEADTEIVQYCLRLPADWCR